MFIFCGFFLRAFSTIRHVGFSQNSVGGDRNVLPITIGANNQGWSLKRALSPVPHYIGVFGKKYI